MVLCRKPLMDFSASPHVSPPWAVVLAVCVAGFLSTYATAAPLILQLDPTTLMGHRLVITIEPLLPKGVTHTNIESNTSVVLLNTTADATNASIIFFGSNSLDTTVTPDVSEMVSADVTTEAGPPPTSTATVTVDSKATLEVISQPLQRSEEINIIADDVQLTNHIIPRIQPRMDDVDNFLINLPHRCPTGWRRENGDCRRPFNGFNGIAKTRSKAMPKRKIKMRAKK